MLSHFNCDNLNDKNWSTFLISDGRLFHSRAPLYCTLLVKARVKGNTTLNKGATLNLVLIGLISSSDVLHRFKYMTFRRCTFILNSSLGVLAIECIRSVSVHLSARKQILIHLFCICWSLSNSVQLALANTISAYNQNMEGSLIYKSLLHNKL